MKNYGKDINSLRIAYSPYSKDYSAPGDRRRFNFYAKESNISLLQYDKNTYYDIVVLSSVADISNIKNLKEKGTIVIIDLVDSYLIKTSLIKDILRNMGREFIHKNYHNLFKFNGYTHKLKKALSIVDAVICTTIKQKEMIKKFNNNVHIILDNMDDDILEIEPKRYKKKRNLDILWEGLPPNLINFKEISSAINNLGSIIDINLHFVTDLESHRFLSKFSKVNTINILKKYNFKVNTFLYQWNNIALSSVASFCDLAIIPILQSNEFVLGKPENKLILLWKLGLPVFTSYTDAYSHTMKKADVNMICKNDSEWQNNLIDFHNKSIDEKIKLSKKVKFFANNNYTKIKLIDQWDNLFLSILKKNPKMN